MVDERTPLVLSTLLMPSEALTGSVGKYEIVRPLGPSALGHVYLARDTILDREVALEVVAAAFVDDPEHRARFERRTRAVARMRHSNVQGVFDFGNHTDGSAYVATERLRGQGLRKAIQAAPTPSVARGISVVKQLLQGLGHAHGAGIVHGGIGPTNIFLTDDGTLKIMGFVGATLGAGARMATLDYMSPEQVKGAKVDDRSDLFQVGCVWYELLAGQRPFRAENLMAIFYKITHEEPDFNLIPAGAECEAMMPVLRRALAKDPNARYGSAAEFAGDLRRAAAAAGVSLASGE